MEKKNFDAAWLDGRDAYFNALKMEIKNLKDAGVFKNKRIAIVGVWNNAGELYKIFQALGLRLTNIADNNPNLWGLSRIGILCQSVESLAREKNTITIIANNGAWQELRSQMLELGLKENKQFYVLFGGAHCRNLALENDSLHMMPNGWANCKSRILEAYEDCKAIIKRYGRMPIWLMHQPSLGDLYIFSLFLPHAMHEKSIKDCKCVLIVSKRSVEKLAKAIGFRNVALVTFEDAYEKWLILLRLLGPELDIHNAVYHGENSVFQNIVHFSDVTFCDSFTKFVFQFADRKEPIYPHFPRRKRVVAKIFDEKKLHRGKTVVISPYAGHFNAKIKVSEWHKLVKLLKEKGYDVCTNCGSKEEKALPGTVPVFFEIQDSVEFVEQAGGFIGVRSGFCDLVCMADCKKVVIYETGAPAASIKYFGFERMGIGKNIKEYINDCIHTKGMLKKIGSEF